MIVISNKAKDRLLNAICLTIGTMMLYRGLINATQYPGDGVHLFLGVVFLGGVASIGLVFRRRVIGWWCFVVLNIVVAIVFIFVLEDIWQHHVLPHIVFAAVFVPFYRDLR